MAEEKLLAKRCVPCEKGTMPLFISAIEKLALQVPEWNVSADHKSIVRSLRFKDFASALLFTNQVGVLAEVEGHHPDIALGWGYVTITLMTHAIGGLSENDFVLAAKIDQIEVV